MRKVLKFLKSIEDYLSPVFLVIMCIAVTAQIIGRVVIKKPLLYTEEVARFSYVWCVYLLIAMGEKYQDHFSVDLFVRFLKGKADIALQIIEKLLGAVVFVYLFYWSIKFVSFERIIRSPAFNISMSWVAASMCFGFLLAAIHRFIHAYDLIKQIIKPARKKDESSQEEVIV